MDLPFRLTALQREDAAYVDNKHLSFFVDLGHERERLNPQFGQLIVPVGDGVINFQKDSKEWSRAYCLGLREDVSDEILDELETLFRERSIKPHIEVNSLADPELLLKLGHRGYAIMDWTSVLVRPLSDSEPFPPPASGIEIEEISATDEAKFAAWRKVYAAAFATEVGESVANTEDLMVYRGTSKGRLFLARYHGQPAGAAVLAILDEIALLVGAGTAPEFRNRGIQSALISHRFKVAVDEGCKVATIYTSQSSASQANAQKLGFYIIYNQVCFRLDSHV